MPTPTKGARLGGSPSHERLILSNLATSLFEHGSITTTQAKAKRLQPLAETLITKAKRGDLHARRRVMRTIRDKSVVHVLFTEIAERFEHREGGYTRISKLGPRKGDNAPMVVIELVEESKPVKQAQKKAAKKAAKAESKVEVKAEESKAEDTGVEETEVEATEAEEATDTAAEEGGVVEGEYGKGSAAPLESGDAPEGFSIKGNKDSMKYHTTESQWYDKTIAEVWFDSEESAETAGFTKAG